MSPFSFPLLVSAIKDRSVAINYFVQRNSRQGVSSQLSEIAREVLAADGKAADAYAAAKAAIQLGGDKPPADQQDDNELLSRATARVAAGERATVDASLSTALAGVTGVPAQLWRTSFNLN